MLVPTYQTIRYHIPEDLVLLKTTFCCICTYCIFLLFLQSLFHTNANFSWPPIKI